MYPALYRNFSVIKEAVAMNNKVSGFVDFSKKTYTHFNYNETSSLLT